MEKQKLIMNVSIGHRITPNPMTLMEPSKYKNFYFLSACRNSKPDAINRMAKNAFKIKTPPIPGGSLSVDFQNKSAATGTSN